MSADGLSLDQKYLKYSITEHIIMLYQSMSLARRRLDLGGSGL